MGLFYTQDTIAALATPPGEGGIAIIRISGPNAISIAEKVFSGPVTSFLSHTVHFGKILLADEKTLDRCLLLIMKRPRSYTGEDVVEIQCHGGHFISHNILNHLFSLGIRQANPGEFTFRAFMNGKMDLAQAEAVQHLICAKNSLAAELAHHQLEGYLSKHILDFQKTIISALAFAEAFLDFPEDDIDFQHLKSIEEELTILEDSIKDLIGTFDMTRKISQGIVIGLIGAPNVGKSSLMNALLEKNRAIVTSMAGTTRDTIEEEFLIDGRLLKLTDTAGMRDSEDPIETEGIQRSKEVEKNADLILWVVDTSLPQLNPIEESLISSLNPSKTFLIHNKIDLLDNFEQKCLTSWKGPQFCISTRTNEGIASLKQEIAQFVRSSLAHTDKHTACLVSHRHFLALKETLYHVKKARTEICNGHFEITAADLRSALSETGKIIGTDITENVLEEIFSRFCIGK